MFEFAMKFIYEDQFSSSAAAGLLPEEKAQQKASISARLQSLTELALQKSKGNYHNLV